MPKRRHEWKEIARRGRNHAVFFVSYITEGFRRPIVEEKMRWGFTPLSYRQFDDARWFHESDVNGYFRAIRRAEKQSPGYLLRKAREYERMVQKIRRWIDRSKRRPFSTMSSNELRKTLEQYVDLYIECNGFLYNYIFINEYLGQEITKAIMAVQPDIQKQMNDMFILISQIKKSEARREKEAIIRLAKKYRKRLLKGEVWGRAVERHLHQYTHLNRYIYYGKSYTTGDIRSRARQLLKENHLQEAIKEVRKSAVTTRQVDRLLTAYSFDRTATLKIRAARYWAYVPTFWDETFIYGVHHLMPLFRAIAKRLGVKYDEFIELTYEEIYAHLRNDERVSPALRKRVHKRYLDSATVLENGVIRLYEGATLQTYTKREKVKTTVKNAASIRELRGQSASIGHAEGVVTLVLSVNEISKVKKGHIMVVPSTTPMHVPAMEKAAAIVTDEGGLLSHAAIVSREMGIPCVVGTKIGTKVFKNGERLLVDAKVGIVRRI